LKSELFNHIDINEKAFIQSTSFYII